MTYTIDKVKSVLLGCAEAVCAEKEQLEHIDSICGDGDLGISMQKGCTALIKFSEIFEGEDIGKFFSRCAMEMNRAAPSTMGTLISAGFMQLGKKFAGCTEIDTQQVMIIPECFAEAIVARGKAKEGDRTILDALLPLCREFANAAEQKEALETAIIKGTAAACAGMEKTKELTPKVGRSKWTPENANGVVDGGALLCCIVAQHLANSER